MGQTASTTKAIESVHNNGLLPQDGGLPREIQMNADVWYLIFAWSLRPLDLLSLARTCKYFRQILMTKSSLSVWGNARRRVEDLPDCPADLSEPAYADLAFCARCHCCGEYTPYVLWRIRRRYCTGCQAEHLCRGFSYIMRVDDTVIPAEDIAVGRRRSMCFERSQVKSLVREYKLADDKKQLLRDKKKRCEAIYEHASQCLTLQPTWQKKMEELESLERQEKERVCRHARNISILERLKKLGYEAEISYFGEHRFQESDGKTLHPLTDIEWAEMLPAWLVRMNQHREQRLDAVFYKPRWCLLKSEYETYVKSRGTPRFDLLPNVDELSRFLPFRDVLKAPEGAQLGRKPFESAFAKLPGLVKNWKEQLDAQLAELVEIPAHLSLQGTPSRQFMVSAEDKLQLACALFSVENHHCFTHLDILPLAKYHNPTTMTESIWERYGIKFSEEAPYVVRACGLDPNVATRDDMRLRNARLMCLTCSDTRIMDWCDAVAHASVKHQDSKPAERSRWQVVSDKHLCVIEAAVKQAVGETLSWRCLLCQPCVADVVNHMGTLEKHLQKSHGVRKSEMKHGVHYKSHTCSAQQWPWVGMVEDADTVTFVVHHR